MVDFTEQRLNMVEGQVRPSDLTDRRVLSSMLEVNREAFLPASLHGVAYSDGELSLASVEGAMSERAMLSPRTVARLIQSLELESQDIVLLVGTGAGYEAALLSHIVQTVVCVESDKGLAAWAEKALQNEHIGNAATVEGRLDDGYVSEGPYDAILINGAVDQIPARLFDQLKDGGRLATIRRHGGVMRLTRWQRDGEHYALSEMDTAAAVVLPAFAREESFQF